MSRKQRNSGFGQGDQMATEADLQRRKQTRAAIIFLLAVAVIGIFVFIVNSNLFYRNMTALNVDGQRFSITDMNFFAANAFSEEDAIDRAVRSATLHRHAVAAGLTLDAEARAEANAWPDMIVEHFNTVGFYHVTDANGHIVHTITSANNFVVHYYGRGMSMRILRERYEFDALGQMYVTLFAERLHESLTSDELEAYYLEHRDNYDRISFRVHEISFTTAEEVEANGGDPEADFWVSQEVARAEAEFLYALATGESPIAVPLPEEVNGENDETDEADEINAPADAVEPGSEAAFIQAIEAVLGPAADQATWRDQLLGGIAHLEYAAWLLDEARAPGDMILFEGHGSFFLLYFVAYEDNRYYTADVRHILIAFDDSIFFEEDGTPLVLSGEEIDRLEAEQHATALARAEEILAEWQSGEQIEARFIELIQAHSDDNWEFQADPGLFADINRQSGLVPEFRAWALDADRQVGDVAIVETQFGLHIMYFVGHSDGLNYRHSLAQRDMTNESYHTWLIETTAAANWNTTFFTRLMTVPTMMW